MEQWKQIEGFGYAVSNLGRVRNISTGRILKLSIENGAPRASLHRDTLEKRVQKFFVSHLVYNYFVKPIGKSVHIRFRNSNNCTPDNLYLMSEEPKIYIRKTKTSDKKEKNNQATLTKTPKESQMDSVVFEGGSSVSELDLYCTVRATSYRNYYIRQSPFN